MFVYRTIEDLEAISEAGKNSTRGVVIGGGLLGLEAAKALKDLGLATHVVEFAPRLMAVQVDEGGGGLLRSRIEGLGVAVHTGKNTTRIDDGESARHRMHFADGGSLETDVVVISAGIRPRDELARACGLEVAPRGGIVINGDCRTSDESIYAIGECAAYEGRVFGLVAPGYQMARIAAARVLGTEGEAFAGADMSTKLKLLGVEVGSIGDAHATTPGARVYSFFDQRKEVYKKLVVDAEGKKLIGAVLVGDTSDYSMWHQTVANAMALPENPETMLFPAAAASAGAPPTNALAALPATAQVCSCNNVSKGGICSAIEAGCTTVGALKTKTKAGTTCGGCTPLVTQILNAELKKRGVNVNTSMCEHFPYTRQQLFHLVRIGELKSFDDVIAQTRQGPGLRHLQAGGRVDPRFVLERVRAQEAPRGAAGHQRLLPRQHAEGRHVFRRAARAGRRDHAREAHRHRRRWRRSTACTPRSPAASASTCSARRCTSCRSSGTSSSTPASNPAMPTARRCAP